MRQRRHALSLGSGPMIKPGVTFADYQETKPRHFHALLDQWLAT